MPSAQPQPNPRTQPAYNSRRTAWPQPEEPGPGRLWVGIVVAVLVAVAVASILHKHQSAKEREQEEAARLQAERAAEIRKDLEHSAEERRRAEDEVRRLATPPPGPVTMDPRPPAPVVESPPSRPAAVAEHPQPPPFRERPGRDRDERPGPPGDKKENYQRMAEQEFRGADHNGDGYLSFDEVRGRFPGIERDFRRVDADGDGRISLHEFFRFRRMQAEQFFRKK